MFLWMECIRTNNHLFFFLMIRRPPRSTLDRSSAASDVYKRQGQWDGYPKRQGLEILKYLRTGDLEKYQSNLDQLKLSLIHISEPTRPY
mgnify:CR=1 FL=1